MAEPRTYAGRALLATLNKYLFEEPSENEAPILAIEQEAIKDERKRLAGLVERLARAIAHPSPDDPLEDE